MNELGIAEWRNEAARQRFIDVEDEFWRERWPVPPTALDVDSYAGTTRVYRWPGAGEPIVFLHGMGGTGLTWSAYVERLVGRDLYAIDTIGDVGRSQQRAVIEDTAGLARWLAETLTGAGIERGHLVGTSYGGFLALGRRWRDARGHRGRRGAGRHLRRGSRRGTRLLPDEPRRPSRAIGGFHRSRRAGSRGRADEPEHPAN
jgi:Alpha/beta hydrolase family